MSRDWRLYLDDIVECSDRVLRYTEGLTYEESVVRDEVAPLRREVDLLRSDPANFPTP